MQQLDGYCMEICTPSLVFKCFGNQKRVKDCMILSIPSICVLQKSVEQVFKACLEDSFGDFDLNFAHDGLSHLKLFSHWLAETGS